MRALRVSSIKTRINTFQHKDFADKWFTPAVIKSSITQREIQRTKLW